MKFGTKLFVYGDRYEFRDGVPTANDGVPLLGELVYYCWTSSP